MKKKIFIVVGELSGEQVADWYLSRLGNEFFQKYEWEGIGGDLLKRRGVKLYSRFEDLNLVGIVELLTKVQQVFSFLKKLVFYLKTQQFDELLLVDFPGFNLQLIKRLKNWQ